GPQKVEKNDEPERRGFSTLFGRARVKNTSFAAPMYRAASSRERDLVSRLTPRERGSFCLVRRRRRAHGLRIVVRPPCARGRHSPRRRARGRPAPTGKTPPAPPAAADATDPAPSDSPVASVPEWTVFRSAGAAAGASNIVGNAGFEIGGPGRAEGWSAFGAG